MSFYDSKINNNLNNNMNSFILGRNDKPKLVDDKILRKIKKKKIQIQKNSYSNRIKKSFMDFIKKNYGILLIILFIVLLLCFRYREVKKRREKKINLASES
tara:strand:- start:5 stop:307 length:303 start_codon:yes stop_codon:yes gene_type:complete